MISVLRKKSKVAGMMLVCACGGVMLGCTAKPKPAPKSTATQAATATGFVRAQVPDSLKTPADRSEYLSRHYWDHFNFGDTSLIHKPDISEQAFVDYLVVLNNLRTPDSAKESIDILLKYASKDKVMQDFFVDLIDRYLYDPNSPYRNENLYILYLQNMLELPTAGAADRSRCEYRLKLAMKNRPGEVSTDFRFIDRAGKMNRLSKIKGDFLLLIFYDPDCPTCKQDIETLQATPLSADSRLAIAAIYPDDDVDAWKENHAEVPANWINGYSPNGEILAKNLYDLRARPTLYLLDSEKRVILKDAPLKYILGFLSQQFAAPQ